MINLHNLAQALSCSTDEANYCMIIFSTIIQIYIKQRTNLSDTLLQCCSHMHLFASSENLFLVPLTCLLLLLLLYAAAAAARILQRHLGGGGGGL